MTTLEYIIDKYKIALPQRRMPIEIPNMGREQLPGLLNELGSKVGAEIGVCSGEYSHSLCKGIPELELYCVDSWVPYSDYHDRWTSKRITSAKDKTIKLLHGYNFHIVDKYSMDAVKEFKDDSLDFVYIDANHELPWVLDDIFHWTKKVRPGGIVAGHDYIEQRGRYTRIHVIPALFAYTWAFKISPWFVIGTRAKVAGEIRDDHRSWMFVREQ